MNHVSVVQAFLTLAVIFLPFTSRADLLSQYLLYPDEAPSRQQIDALNTHQSRLSRQSGSKDRLWFSITPVKEEGLSYYKHKSLPGSGRTRAQKVFVLYFTGNAGGAFMGSPWQSLYPSDWDVEEWAFDFPGFGGQKGKADLKLFPAFSEKTWHRTRQHARSLGPDVKFLISGYSLGSALALHLGRNFSADGLLLFNAPTFPDILHLHVHDVAGKFLGAISTPLIWWMFPGKFDSLKNAKKCLIPAVFIGGGEDEIAPPANQEKLFRNYQGPRVRHLVSSMGHQPDQEETVQIRESVRASLNSLLSSGSF